MLPKYFVVNFVVLVKDVVKKTMNFDSDGIFEIFLF